MKSDGSPGCMGDAQMESDGSPGCLDDAKATSDGSPGKSRKSREVGREVREVGSEKSAGTQDWHSRPGRAPKTGLAPGLLAVCAEGHPRLPDPREFFRLSLGMRKLRYIPQEGTLVEVTCRTLHSRLLMRPSPEVYEIVVGVLGRAQELYPVTVCGAVCMSNHYHFLLVVPDAHRLSQFMLYVNSNLARELGRLIGWREKFWSRRYQAIVVSGEEAAQVDRLRYLLSHGCKERLVSKARDWPGVHSARALLNGMPLTGYWFDRTRESAARSRGENPERLAYATPYEIHLSPLPCWRHLSPEEVRQRVTTLVQEIEEEAAQDCRRRGVVPLGARAPSSPSLRRAVRRTRSAPPRRPSMRQPRRPERLSGKRTPRSSWPSGRGLRS